MSDGVTRVPDHLCPYCSHKLSAIGEMSNQGAPRPGDVTLCIECAGLLVLDADLRAQKPTIADLQVIANSEAWPEISRAVRRIKAMHAATKGAVN